MQGVCFYKYCDRNIVQYSTVIASIKCAVVVQQLRFCVALVLTLSGLDTYVSFNYSENIYIYICHLWEANIHTYIHINTNLYHLCEQRHLAITRNVAGHPNIPSLTANLTKYIDLLFTGSIYLSVYPYTYTSIHLSACLSVSIYPSTEVSRYTYFCQGSSNTQESSCLGSTSSEMQQAHSDSILKSKLQWHVSYVLSWQKYIYLCLSICLSICLSLSVFQFIHSYI